MSHSEFKHSRFQHTPTTNYDPAPDWTPKRAAEFLDGVVETQEIDVRAVSDATIAKMNKAITESTKNLRAMPDRPTEQ